MVACIVSDVVVQVGRGGGRVNSTVGVNSREDIYLDGSEVSAETKAKISKWAKHLTALFGDQSNSFTFWDTTN